jgi:ferredoxin-type protein NapH
MKMLDVIQKNRYLVLRRVLQIGLLILFGGASWWEWNFLRGNYSSAFVMGSFYLTDPHAVLQTLAAGFLMGTNAIIGALIILIFYALIAGRSFCSWVCSVNILTDLAAWLRKKWHISKKENILKFKRITRYWVLLLGLILSMIWGIAAFEVINPVTMLHRGIIFGFGIGWTYVAAVFLFDLLVTGYGWCGHLCPLGAFYSIIGKYSFIKVKHNEKACTLCMLCKDVCHEKQVLAFIGQHSGYIGGECSNCGRCIEVCDDGALKYSIRKIKSGGNNNE